MPRPPRCRPTIHALIVRVLAICFVASAAAISLDAQQLPPVQHTIRLTHPAEQRAEIELAIPTGGQSTVSLQMPVWGPGFYSIENFAENLSDLTAQTPDGKALTVDSVGFSRWKISTGGAPVIHVRYQLKCDRYSVVTNWTGDAYAVFNGPATFVQVDDVDRGQRVRLELPENWQAFTGLETIPDRPAEYFAADYDTLIDCPILASPDPGIQQFEVAGVPHYLVDATRRPDWDAAKAAANVRKIVEATHAFWGELPFENYYFLNTFDTNGGGLEHLNSTLISTRVRTSEQGVPTWESFRWLSFVSHEYFHAFNVKRLRPLELGPFDYLHPPRTPSLWISEGLTSYYGDLLVVRAELAEPDAFLQSLSRYIQQLQRSPGRLKQSLAGASLDVWSSGMSGMPSDPDRSVSYYIKGPVVGFLLDAKIRRVTGGDKSLDDVMHLAYQKYSGDRGFTPGEFVAVAEAVAGIDLDGWFETHIASTQELDYAEALDWFGLAFETSAEDPWRIVERQDATPQQKAQFDQLTEPARSLIGSPD